MNDHASINPARRPVICQHSFQFAMSFNVSIYLMTQEDGL